MTRTFIKNPWISAAIWGLTGGLLMFISRSLPFEETWKKELPMILAFIGCQTGLFYSIRVRTESKKFLLVLFASLTAWMLMFIVPHTILAFQIGGYGNLWWIPSFFQALGVGVFICTPLTWITIRVRKNSLVGTA